MTVYPKVEQNFHKLIGRREIEMPYTLEDVILHMSSDELEDALDTALEVPDRSKLVWPIINEMERRDSLISL